MTKEIRWGVGSIAGVDNGAPCVFLYVGDERLDLSLNGARYVRDALSREIEHAEGPQIRSTLLSTESALIDIANQRAKTYAKPNPADEAANQRADNIPYEFGDLHKVINDERTGKDRRGKDRGTGGNHIDERKAQRRIKNDERAAIKRMLAK